MTGYQVDDEILISEVVLVLAVVVRMSMETVHYFAMVVEVVEVKMKPVS